MKEIYRQKSLEYWDEIHKDYDRAAIKVDDWLERFNDIIEVATKPILDLGCGSGNDTLYLINKGKKVISCDQSPSAIQNISKNFPEVYDVKCFNMLDGIPFEDETFEVVIADLCLHYFLDADTKKILNDIKRILEPGGHLILRVNSVNDVLHGAGDGREIEHHVYEMEGKTIKRFFDDEDIRYYFKDFNIEYMNEEIMTRYKLEKRLYRVCVRNQSEGG